MEVPAPIDAECPLPDSVAGLALARDFTLATLTGWGFGAVADDALLIVTELATNAVEHGAGKPLLRLRHAGAVVRVEVADDSPVLPATRPAGPDGGWGLRLVRELSLGWGVTPATPGKVVWCELGLSPRG
ncbi:ATP-binding protein [Amycolatopsis rhabdoformis]|uniref:ATP-binding protein n=1 Tax=Amycolatopsis rhabdoformis TaxID=1448059 RepID=A0ABZ1IJE0_9PSEU|nr:ATP-binding protein [Amycolatopsis rhabdoformis]WSE34299.1 ATP-binding protein [Amycolatopsis rhabdoformis]